MQDVVPTVIWDSLLKDWMHFECIIHFVLYAYSFKAVNLAWKWIKSLLSHTIKCYWTQRKKTCLQCPLALYVLHESQYYHQYIIGYRCHIMTITVSGYQSVECSMLTLLPNWFDSQWSLTINPIPLRSDVN